MKFISLFAGIGGFDLGLERAGMECVAQVEIDEFCGKILKKHWPDVPLYKDVRDVGKHNLPDADVICGGFPCQPHSLAGKRRGEEDDRNLWPEYFRIIDELRPAWVIGENVPGIRTTILDSMLSDLENIEYTTVTLDIPAVALNAPHIRHRYFIVAHAKSRDWNLSAIAGQQKETLHTRRNGEAQFVAHANGTGWKKFNSAAIANNQRYHTRGNAKARGAWTIEPGICRVANGVPDRVDRIKSLGNAVVPQVVEVIGRAILEAEKH